MGTDHDKTVRDEAAARAHAPSRGSTSSGSQTASKRLVRMVNWSTGKFEAGLCEAPAVEAQVQAGGTRMSSGQSFNSMSRGAFQVAGPRGGSSPGIPGAGTPRGPQASPSFRRATRTVDSFCSARETFEVTHDGGLTQETFESAHGTTCLLYTSPSPTRPY